MFFLIGLAVVLGSVGGGYVSHHGNLAVLWQPSEFIIILGAALGAFIIGNPPRVLKGVLKNLKNLLKSAPYSKKDYLELLVLIGVLFKMIKSKGILSIEADIEKPEESQLFMQYPKFLHNHHAVDFLCDYIRLLNMGFDNQYHLEEAMTNELDLHHTLDADIPGAVNAMGDGMPALGIVAAVLGVITTMGSITEPPEVLGKLIGAALVGTFFGVLMSYGIIGPMGSNLAKFMQAEARYMECIKIAILAHIRGNAPTVTVEIARKTISSDVLPTFAEVETAMNEQSSGGAK